MCMRMSSSTSTSPLVRLRKGSVIRDAIRASSISSSSLSSSPIVGADVLLPGSDALGPAELGFGGPELREGGEEFPREAPDAAFKEGDVAGREGGDEAERAEAGRALSTPGPWTETPTGEGICIVCLRLCALPAAI